VEDLIEQLRKEAQLLKEQVEKAARQGQAAAAALGEADALRSSGVVEAMLEAQGRRPSSNKQPGVAEVLIALERGEALPAVQTSHERSPGDSGTGLVSSTGDGDEQLKDTSPPREVSMVERRERHGERRLVGAPQLATPACLPGLALSRPWMVLSALEERSCGTGPNERPRHGQPPRPKSPILRLPTPRRDPALEAELWVAAVTGRESGGRELQAWLRSGVVLCQLANCLQPGLVPRVSEADKPFKQMENIGGYLDACRKYGVPAQDNFLTVDLFEGKNMNAVVRNLHSLGRVAQQQGFSGPTLGARLATTNRRSFTAEQMAQVPRRAAASAT
jgi:hypothetical protein